MVLEPGLSTNIFNFAISSDVNLFGKKKNIYKEDSPPPVLIYYVRNDSPVLMILDPSRSLV